MAGGQQPSDDTVGAVAPLLNLITTNRALDSGALLGRFLEFVEGRQLQLYPAQEAAILELFDGKNVILNTPTGSGKSLVATALHFQSLASRRRSVYTCPIKALVNENWLALCREFGPERCGLSTGDAGGEPGRTDPLLHGGDSGQYGFARGRNCREKQDIVMDEFHYYADREMRRGPAAAPLLTLPQSRFLLMSATLGETSFFEEELTRLNGRETVTVAAKERPVPLEFSYAETPLTQTLEALVSDGKAPVYVVHFTQADAAQSAQDFMSTNVCTREEKAAISNALEGFKFSSALTGREIRKRLAARDLGCITPVSCRSIACWWSNRATRFARRHLWNGHARCARRSAPCFAMKPWWDQRTENGDPERPRLSPNRRPRRPQRL